MSSQFISLYSFAHEPNVSWKVVSPNHHTSSIGRGSTQYILAKGSSIDYRSLLTDARMSREQISSRLDRPIPTLLQPSIIMNARARGMVDQGTPMHHRTPHISGALATDCVQDRRHCGAHSACELLSTTMASSLSPKQLASDHKQLPLRRFSDDGSVLYMCTCPDCQESGSQQECSGDNLSGRFVPQEEYNKHQSKQQFQANIRQHFPLHTTKNNHRVPPEVPTFQQHPPESGASSSIDHATGPEHAETEVAATLEKLNAEFGKISFPPELAKGYPFAFTKSPRATIPDLEMLDAMSKKEVDVLCRLAPRVQENSLALSYREKLGGSRSIAKKYKSSNSRRVRWAATQLEDQVDKMESHLDALVLSQWKEQWYLGGFKNTLDMSASS